MKESIDSRIVRSVEVTYNDWNREEENEPIDVTHQRFIDEALDDIDVTKMSLADLPDYMAFYIDGVNKIFLEEADIEVSDENILFARNCSLELYGQDMQSEILERLQKSAQVYGENVMVEAA